MPTQRSALDVVLNKSSRTSQSVSTMPIHSSASVSVLTTITSESVLPSGKTTLFHTNGNSDNIDKISKLSGTAEVTDQYPTLSGITDEIPILSDNSDVNGDIPYLSYLIKVITDTLQNVKRRNIVPTSKDQGLHYPSFNSARVEEDTSIYIQYLTSVQQKYGTDSLVNEMERMKNLLADSLCSVFTNWCVGNEQRPTRTPQISFQTKSQSEFQAIVLQTLTHLEMFVTDWKKASP